ncbi:MAG TPA: STAS domain-containing protein [Gaiellaceae bacterium]|nr:STAS domain-containing protein [Gaiellaceae bacterium]
MQLRADVERFPRGIALSLSGELDAYQAPALREAFAELVEGHEGFVLVLDLSAVSFLDSTALGTMVGAVRRLRETGGELRLVLPAGPARRIFELTSLDQVLEIRPSRGEAMAG